MTADQNLLDVLQAHGERFLASFALPDPTGGLKKRKRLDTAQSPRKSPKIDSTSDAGEEWGGINEQNGEVGTDDDELDSQVGESEDFEQEDDDFTASSSSTNSKVVVFQDVSFQSKKAEIGLKAQMKAFMSSKVSKLRQDDHAVPAKEKTEAEEEDERTNAQNDALLHRLVHTQLLSGSLNQDLDMTPAQRRKALAGRVLELSGAAKLGNGEKSVREKERNKASKRVREGLIDKQKERARKELEEAKELGNYHPTLKKLYEDSTGTPPRKRERGLKMGVGTFRGGYLRLSREDISMVEGGGQGTGRGRGSSRGSSGVGGRSRGKGRSK
ncbi:hypothetical protein LshimejAT787_0106050 [Lyophyllum shimeji]|uniref:Uncharacterized protein n=1 Tax=Lyophyllum shimeji TaxID=47721 RepID=A0A9P3PDZ8_LYOSH|nr:hypothetical protein LshimejAT787_0106050 [Lyophyllum shimeji]